MKSVATQARTSAHTHTHTRPPGSLPRSIQCILLASTGAAAKESQRRGEGLKGTKAMGEPPPPTLQEASTHPPSPRLRRAFQQMGVPR